MIIDLRKKTDRLLVEYRHARQCVREEKEHLAATEKAVADTLEAQQVLQGVAETIQNQVHQRIASVVSRCLEAVFPDAYEFRITFRQLRGKTEATLYFVRDGQEIDPVEASGGGVVDLASFSLRLACLTLSLPRKRRLLVLDEPLKHLSKDYRPAVRTILMTLAKELQVQFVIVSHMPELAMGKVIEI